MKHLLSILLLAPLLTWAQVKPTASFGVGFNNSAPIHGFLEAGAEINNTVGLWADYKITYGLNTWHAFGAKGGLILSIGQGDDEYLMLHVGAQYFSFPPKYELDSKVKPSIGFRWQYYNVTTDFTYSGGFGFITLAWQFKKLECFK
jgi:hypothetical protein